MAPSLMPGVDLDAMRDQEDCTRRVLAETVVPRSIAEIQSIFDGYVSSGMVTRTPSGKLHSIVCDVASIVRDLEASGWIHKILGETWDAMAKHTDELASTLSHDYPDGDGGRVNRVVEWAASPERDAWDPHADHWSITHDGFEALTGHKQGERPEPEPEDVDPSEIQPADIGDA